MTKLLQSMATIPELFLALIKLDKYYCKLWKQIKIINKLGTWIINGQEYHLTLPRSSEKALVDPESIV